MAMHICRRCQARNAPSSTFCLRCGAPLREMPADEAAVTDALAEVPPELNPSVLVDEAAAQLAEGRAQAAIENCRRALALDPRNIEAYAVLGMAYEQRGDLTAALEAYESVLQLNPDRPVERQKAALLRLRLGHGTPADTSVRFARSRRARTRLSLAGVWEAGKQFFSTNPALSVGLAVGLFVFLVGTALLISVSRTQARAARLAQYEQEIQTARRLVADQRYAEATSHYEAAWKLKPEDPNIRWEWEQAYRQAQAIAQEQQRQMEIARLPKYIPNLTGRNPFAPVPIPSSKQPNASAAATPPMASASPAGGYSAPPAVPPPTLNASARPYEQWQAPARPVPSSPSASVSSRRPITPVGASHAASGTNPITPGTTNKVTEKPAAEATTAPTDTSGKSARGEITIWVTPPPAKPAAANRPSGPSSQEAAALRAEGEQLAREGRLEEALQRLERAESAYRELSRQDPNNAAAYNAAAESCRARLELLRQNNR